MGLPTHNTNLDSPSRRATAAGGWGSCGDGAQLERRTSPQAAEEKGVHPTRRRRTSQLSPAHEIDVVMGAAVRPASALQMAVAAVGFPQVVVTPVADDDTTTALQAVVAASEPCSGRGGGGGHKNGGETTRCVEKKVRQASQRPRHGAALSRIAQSALHLHTAPLRRSHRTHQKILPVGAICESRHCVEGE